MKKIIILLVLAVSLFAMPRPLFAATVGNNFNKYTNTLIGNAEQAIMTAGPTLAAKLVGVSGQIFNYLAVIAVVLFAVKEILFGDKGIKEFMIFFLFLIFAKGLLMAYNLFFYQGVYGFFNGLGQKVSGGNSPMAAFDTLFQTFYGAIVGMNAANNQVPWWNVFGKASTDIGFALTVIVGQIMLLIEALVILGTVVLVQVYVVIALLTGYIFVPFMIIKPLEFLWNGWLKFLITACFSWFLIYLVTGLLNATVLILNNDIKGGLTPGEMISFLLIMGIFAYIYLKIPSVAGEIVSGMPNMSFSGVVSVAIGAAAVMIGAGRIATGGAKAVAGGAKGVGRDIARSSTDSGTRFYGPDGKEQK